MPPKKKTFMKGDKVKFTMPELAKISSNYVELGYKIPDTKNEYTVRDHYLSKENQGYQHILLEEISNPVHEGRNREEGYCSYYFKLIQ